MGSFLESSKWCWNGGGTLSMLSIERCVHYLTPGCCNKCQQGERDLEGPRSRGE